MLIKKLAGILNTRMYIRLSHGDFLKTQISDNSRVGMVKAWIFVIFLFINCLGNSQGRIEKH